MEDLFAAIDENDAETIELAAEEEDVNIEGYDDDGYTPLCRAALKGFSDSIEALLLVEAEVNAKMQGPPGLSPLMCAATKGHMEAVEMLLENEADPTATNTSGQTALALAELAGQQEVAMMLLELGGSGGSGDGGSGGVGSGFNDGFDAGFDEPEFAESGFDDGGFGGGNGPAADGSFEATLSKGDSPGWGMSLTGPSGDGDTRVGVYVSKVKYMSPAAMVDNLEIKCRILSINKIDVSRCTRKQAAAFMKKSGESMLLKFIPDPEGFQQYEVAASTNEFAGQVKSIELAYASNGVGVLIKAPTKQNEVKRGVYVRGVVDLSSAYASNAIMVGMRVLEINGVSVQGALTQKVEAMLQTPKNNKVTLKVQYDPIGYSEWDGGAELDRHKKSKATRSSPVASSGPARHLEVTNRWWFGSNSKDAIAGALRSQPAGVFAVRAEKKKLYVSLNDNGDVAHLPIQMGSDGSAKFEKKQYQTLDDIMRHISSAPRKSKFGGTEFVATAPLPGGIEFNYYEWSTDMLPTPALSVGAKRGATEVKVATSSELKAAKSTAKKVEKERRRSIKLEKKAAKAAQKQVDEWVCPAFPVKRIAIAKRDAQAFGIQFIGPESVKAPQSGIYIVAIEAGSAAAEAGGLEKGMKILAMNGQPMVLATTQDAVSSLRDSVTAIMTMQLDPVGFSQYDQGALLARIKSEDTGEPVPTSQDDGFGGFGDDDF